MSPVVSVWPLPRRPRRRYVAAVIAVVMVASLAAAPAYAQMPARPAPPRTPVPAVDVKPVPPAKKQPRPERRLASAKPAPIWPKAGSVEVTPTAGGPPQVAAATASQRGAKVGTQPMWVAQPDTATGDLRQGGRPTQSRPAGPRLRVTVLDRPAVAAAQARGVLLRVARTDAIPAGTTVVTVDYRGFATAYGGDWASRLRLVALPECALTTSGRRACAGRVLPTSLNNVTAGTVSAAVDLSTGGPVGVLLLLEAGSSGAAGDYTATPLQPSSTWTAGGNSGAFTWSYPMRVPPAVNGPAPTVGLSYSSQSVDGRHAASNNQPSQVGEGFELNAGGFIERRYRGCGDDMGGGANNTVKTGDQCWATDNATLSLAGHSGELIYNSGEGRWHLRGDDGSRVQRFTGADNGDNNGEYWIVTTTDGVQYWFGAHKLPGWTSGDDVTNSVWTAPVFGNHAGEPCHQAAFADSSCTQAWRWNLDYVVDLHNNSMSFWYVKDTNKYGRNNDPDDDVTYVRGGYLDRIAYGTRRSGGVDSVLDSDAPARVVFAPADRCLSSCGTHGEAQWPDTPWDSECTGSSCSVTSPTFWTTRRVSTITTQVHNGTSYDNVERWTLSHAFPDPGDGTRAGLWLDKISHQGLRAGTAAVSDIEFTEVSMDNRVDSDEGIPPLAWFRVARIDTETGGAIAVTYSDRDCDPADPMPTPHTNTQRCYPSKWTPEGETNPITDWFHKYVVTEVREADNTGGGPEVVYRYSYLDGAAWHYNDDDGLIKPSFKTWSDWRGYARVGVTVGEDPDPGQRTYTETRYFRGMHGDRLPTGSRTVTLPATGSAPIVNDEDWWASMAREQITFNGPGGPVVSRTITAPWNSAATATRTINGDTVTAQFTGIDTTWAHTARDGGRSDRITKTVNTFDTLGMVVAVDDLGEDGVPGDEMCTTTTYEPRNTTAWLMNAAHRVRSFAVDCAAATTPSTLGDADVIADNRTFYDSQAHGAAPTLGEVTKTEKMATFNADNPTWVTANTYAYDTHGRVVETRDALNNPTTTGYTPAAGGPVTATTITNALGHVVTTTVDPAWGSAKTIVDANTKRTDLRYDPLGRLTGVWLPGRDVATETASMTFSYYLRDDGPTSVRAQKLNPAGDYITSYTLYDALLRVRQTQAPSPSGGRILTNTFYDKLGRTEQSYGAYYATGAPGDTVIAVPADPHDVPTQTRTVYDGAGRVVGEIFEPYDVERWRTTTAYGGDRTDATPPEGGTATSTVTDARGRTIQLRQYHDPADVGQSNPALFDATGHQYNRKGQLVQVADAAGNHWTYTYDLRGRKATETDPDRGTTTYGYDNADRITSTIDGRLTKLVYTYDALGRKKNIYWSVPFGNPLVTWGYDTLAKGQLDASIRINGGNAYVTAVTGYTDTYRPTGHRITIPTAETGLGGTYDYAYTYNPDGSRATTTLPAVGGLPAETVNTHYNDLGQPTELTSAYGSTALSYVSATAYNALGQVDQYSLDVDPDTGDRVRLAYGRELETGRLTQFFVDLDAAPWVATDRRYSYDDAGNITTIADVTPNPDDTQCFAYDYLRRLTDAWTPTSGDCQAAPSTAGLGGPAPYWHSWTYDAAGNRLSQVIHAAGGDTTSTYTHPAAGSPRPHAVTSVSTTGPGGTTNDSYSYDNMGNTTSRPAPGGGTQTLTWNVEARLASTSDASGTTSYLYDADGKRLISRDPAGKTLYLPGQDLRYDTATATTSCTRRYTHNGATVASRNSSGLTWLATDYQGTQTVAIDQATLSVTQRRQTPFGAARGGTPAWPNTRGYVDGVNDPTGMVHVGAREYDAGIGRFISVDPVFDLSDPQSWTGYAYAANTPITASDPTGTMLDPGGGSGSSSSCTGQCAAYSGYYTQQYNQSQRVTPRNTVRPPQCTAVTPEYCHAPGSEGKGPYGLGVQWLTGELSGCPDPTTACHDVVYFREGDYFTEQFRALDSVWDARVAIAIALANGETHNTVHFHYSKMSPEERKAQAKNDTKSIFTGGRVGTPSAQAFIGSYDMEWEVVGYDANGDPVVEFHMTNASTWASGKPDWQKVRDYPEGSAGDGHNAAPGEHWLQQSMRFRETFPGGGVPTEGIPVVSQPSLQVPSPGTFNPFKPEYWTM